MIVNIRGYKCKAEFGQYFNRNNALQLIDSEDGQLVATASVNGEMEVPGNVIGIKTWSENEGMAGALINAGVIEPELQFTEATGFVKIEYYRLTPESLKTIERMKADQT